MITELSTILYIMILLFILIMSVITFGCMAILSTSIKTMVSDTIVFRLWNKIIK